jgi:hypothetical protein
MTLYQVLAGNLVPSGALSFLFLLNCLGGGASGREPRQASDRLSFKRLPFTALRTM